MQIKEKTNGLISDVFAITWRCGLNVGQIGLYTNFYMAFKNAGGLIGCNSDEVEIVDGQIKGKWVYFCNENIQGIFYAPLVEEKLFDDLVEYDPDAFEKFLQHAKCDGLLEPDFY